MKFSKKVVLAVAGAAAVCCGGAYFFYRRHRRQQQQQEGGDGESAQAIAQLMEMANQLKQKGNDSVRRGSFEEALQAYQITMDMLRQLPADFEDGIALQQVVLSNVVHVLLKQGNSDDALTVATNVLQNERHPIKDKGLQAKLLYRRSMAMKKLGMLEGAVSDLRAAVSIAPAPDATLEEELKAVESLLQKKA